MLLSLEKNFIFIHIPKTAGTSITSALQPWCPRPKLTQWRRLLSHLPVREAPERALLRQHGTADWLRRKLPRAIYENAHKFAVVRNPFELAVSTYYFRRGYLSRRYGRGGALWDLKTFLRYLERKNQVVPVDQTNWIADRRGVLIIDEVLRFETLAEQFNPLAERLRLPAEVQLERLNTTRHRDYRSYYDDEAMGIVQRLYARDFERFGYAF